MSELEEYLESLFLNLFDFHIIQQIFIQLSNSRPFYEDIKDCYSDCTSFSLTSKLFNSISKQTQFSIKIFQNQKIENINFNIYLKLNYILKQEPIKNQTFNSKKEILNQILLYISKKGIYNLIETLISNGADPNYEDQDYLNYNPLIYSCKYGHYKTTKLLILNNSDINWKTEGDETLLHFGCSSGNLKLVKYLVKLGLDINPLDKFGDSPLNYACGSGNLDLVKFLINNGSNVNIQNNFHENILFAASRSGNLDLVKYLIVEKELNINQENGRGETILFRSTNLFKNIDLIDYLLSLGLNINHRNDFGKTPIWVACAIKSLELVKYLVSKGADLTIEDENDKNVLESLQEEEDYRDFAQELENYLN